MLHEKQKQWEEYFENKKRKQKLLFPSFAPLDKIFNILHFQIRLCNYLVKMLICSIIVCKTFLFY